MRVALISDLHGNEVALDAVLAHIARTGVDRIACLGDTATLGPRPGAVLARLRELGCPCIEGNHDAFLRDPTLVHAYTEAPVIAESVTWCRAQLTGADFAFAATFLSHLRIDLGHGISLLLVHGSPRSNMEDMLATTAPELLDAMIAGPVAEGATVIAAGHTHVQMLRQHGGTLLVNPGSVGSPFERYVHGGVPKVMPHTEYAIVEASADGVSVQLHRLALDPAALRAAALASDFPLREFLVAQYA